MGELIAQETDLLNKAWDAADKHGPWALILFIALGLLVWAVRSIYSTFAPPAVEVLKGHTRYLSESTQAMAVIADTVRAQGKDDGDAHTRTHRALKLVGNAIQASADDTRKPAVQPHIDALKEGLQ